jgi:hypothetical protein
MMQHLSLVFLDASKKRTCQFIFAATPVKKKYAATYVHAHLVDHAEPERAILDYNVDSSAKLHHQPEGVA